VTGPPEGPHDPEWPDEEPWEASIGELLSRLPPVDPPDGFLRKAVDHRPKYAGRLSVLSLVTVTATVAAVVGLGLVGDPDRVAPAVPALAERHLRVAAGGLSLGPGSEDTFEAVEEVPPPVVTMPEAFEPMATVEAGEVVHVVYEHEGQAVSVFVQEGSVSWDDLPDGGLVHRGDRPMWVDPDDERVVVLDVAGHAVTVVGLEVDAVARLLGSEPTTEVRVVDRLRALARDVARQAGFP
jgi:hypothetical protein